MKIILRFIFLLIIFSCNNAVETNKLSNSQILSNDIDNKEFKVENDSLKILLFSEKERILFYDDFIEPTFLKNSNNSFSNNNFLYNIRDYKYRINYTLKSRELISIKANEDFLTFESVDKNRVLELNYSTENYKRQKLDNSRWFFHQALLEKKYSENPTLRNQEFEKEYKNTILFLNEYVKKYNLLNNFKNVQIEQAKYDLLEKKLLFTPVAIKSFPQWYLDSLCKMEIFKFENDKMLYFSSYRQSAFQLSYLFSLKNKNYTGITNHYNLISKNFKNKTKDWLLLKLLEDTIFGKYSSQKDKLEAKKLAIQYANDCKTPEYNSYIQKSLNLKNISVKNDELINIQKQITSFGKINNNQITYFDFWASWCAPCRAEMPNSKKLKDEYSKKGINFIYISTDENPAAWEKAMRQIGLPETESYLLPKGNESSLAKKFKIQSIPRYLIMNKDGEVINQDAPRPSDLKIRQIFDDLLKK